MADCGSFQSPADARNRGHISTRCGRLSVEGEAEEIAVSPKPRARQRHEKRSNPYSTSGFDNFQSVYGELSAKRRYVAYKIGVPEAMVRFVFSRKGWIPVVIAASDQETGKKLSGGDDARVSTLGSPVKNNGEMGLKLTRKDKGNDINGQFERKGLPVSALTSPVRSHRDPADFWATASRRAVNPKTIAPEHGHQWATASLRAVNPNPTTIAPEHGLFHRNHMAPEHEQHHHKMLRRYVSMNNWPRTRPESPVLGSDSFCRKTRPDSFYRKTRPAVVHNANVGAISMGAFTVILILMLFCFAILFISAWLCLFPLFREDEYE